jgi:cytochrome P450
MVRAADEAEANSDSFSSKAPHLPTLSKSELIGNSFILFFAGHETSANSIHFSILLLAMHLDSQRKMQADIDSIIGRGKPISEFSYHSDMPRLFNSMVGAVLNEQLRLIPATLSVPKVANGDQIVTMDGREFVIRDGTSIQLNVVGTNRNPRYWPSAPSKVTPGTNDLDDFVPERWLRTQVDPRAEKATPHKETEAPDGLEQTSFDTTAPGSLFKPVKGSFLTFSEGMRACPGRRFAQVEVTAVLSAIFQRYSVELDVSDWASDAELDLMEIDGRGEVYQQATERARRIIKRCEQRLITLQLKPGDHVPVRFVERGKERFAGFL